MNLSKRNLSIFAGVAIAAIFFALALWIVPRWQSDAYRAKFTPENIQELKQSERIQLEKAASDVENSARVTLAQIIGGLALLAGLYFTYKNIRVTEEGKITERFSKAVEMLGSEKLDVRLGGIYALERIARDSQKDHWTVMEVLTAFIRQNSYKKLELPENQNITGSKKQNISFEEYSKSPAGAEELSMREDIQAIMSVIGKRKWIETEYPKRLDLSRVNMRAANLNNAALSGANLSNADLSGANASYAILNGANFSGANLSNADLSGANLNKANFSGANLHEAKLWFSDLSGTNLNGVDLRQINLFQVNLSKANLIDSNLCGTKLSRANLSNAALCDADLSSADLDGANLYRANLLRVNLSQANLSGTDLRKAFFLQADLSRANIDAADLREAEDLTLKQILSARNFRFAKLPLVLKKEIDGWNAEQADKYRDEAVDSPENPAGE